MLIELSFTSNLQQIVTNQFSRVASNERCSFIGNVSLGTSVSLSELREIYHVVSSNCLNEVHIHIILCNCIMPVDFHRWSLTGLFFFSWTVIVLFDWIHYLEQVVLAYGAESDRVLGVPGEVRFSFLFLHSEPLYFFFT